jgi:hypothetical protein
MDKSPTGSPANPAEDLRHSPANAKRDPAMPVRLADLEPYVGLGYLSKLFKLMAVILLLLLVSEIITGLVTQGTTSIPTLLGEMSRLVVLAPSHRHGTRRQSDANSPRQTGLAPDGIDWNHTPIRHAPRRGGELRGAWTPIGSTRLGIRPDLSSSFSGC